MSIVLSSIKVKHEPTTSTMSHKSNMRSVWYWSKYFGAEKIRCMWEEVNIWCQWRLKLFYRRNLVIKRQISFGKQKKSSILAEYPQENQTKPHVKRSTKPNWITKDKRPIFAKGLLLEFFNMIVTCVKVFLYHKFKISSRVTLELASCVKCGPRQSIILHYISDANRLSHFVNWNTFLSLDTGSIRKHETDCHYVVSNVNLRWL